MRRLERWIPLLVCAGAAVLVLFPMSVYPGLVHRTPNTPLHLLALDHLMGFFQGEVSDLSRVIAADYPTGRPVRIIGWPMHLIALPLRTVMGRVAAINLSLLVLLFLSGAVFVQMLRRMGLGTIAQTVGGLAWICNPLLVSFLSNGQYENHVGWAFPLVIIGLLRGGLLGHAAIAVALLGAAFSSPYQLIPVALVLCCVLPTQRQRSWPALGMTLSFVFLVCYAYFSGPQPTPGGECGPTSGSMPLVLAELFGWTGDIPPLLPPRPDRWSGFMAVLNDPVVWTSDLELNRLVVAPGTAFLGLVPLVGGLAGMWVFRASEWVRPLGWAAMSCLALALGPDLVVRRGLTLDLPMPADALAWLPGLTQMGTTLRFATGIAFVLVIGFAMWVEWAVQRLRRRRYRPRAMAALVVLLVAGIGGEWLFGTVSPVPLEARASKLPGGFSALPDTGAVLAVPVMQRVPPEAHLWMGAILDRSVVGYCAESILDLRDRYAVVNYAQGGALPNPSQVRGDFAALSEAGIGYVAFFVAEPGAHVWSQRVLRIQRLMGPADALGDGVIGYRTDRTWSANDPAQR